MSYFTSTYTKNIVSNLNLITKLSFYYPPFDYFVVVGVLSSY